jgi:hypothetical protein
MKIYLSGKIDGLPKPVYMKKFADAAELWLSLGFEVVSPLNNGLPENAPRRSHLIKDYELMLGCDAIFMLDNWQNSNGAKEEYYIALHEGLEIEFETSMIHINRYAMLIKNAVHEVTGLTFTDYTTKSRKRDGFFARMMFVYHCRQNHMKVTDIAKLIHRDHSSVLHLLNKYNDEVKYNPSFRLMAERVTSIIIKTNVIK